VLGGVLKKRIEISAAGKESGRGEEHKGGFHRENAIVSDFPEKRRADFWTFL
jgi:hypothetical protein